MRVPRVTKRMSELSFYRRTTNAQQSIPTETATIVDFEDEYASEGNALTYTPGAGYTAATGVWTTPPRWTANRKCRLQINTSIQYAALGATNDIFVLGIDKNGSVYSTVRQTQDTGNEQSPGMLSDIIELEKDEYFDIRAYHATGADKALHVTSTRNFISIHEQPYSQPVDA